MNRYLDNTPGAANIVSSNPAHGEVYSTKHYVIKSVNDFRQVSGFLRDIPVSSTNQTIKLTYCWKWH
jgi:hypothetical protein